MNATHEVYTEKIISAVLQVYGSKILNPANAAQARSIVAMLATQAGISNEEIGKSLHCSLATVVQCHMSCSHSVATGDSAISTKVQEVEAVLNDKAEMGCQLVAKAEVNGLETFTEIDAGEANDSQRLVLTLLAFRLHGTVIGKYKTLFEYPFPPADKRIQSALSLVNSLAVSGGSAKTAIAELFEADAYTIG